MTSFNFPVDEAFARKHNEFFRDARRFQWSAGILGGLLVIGALILFLVVAEPWAVMLSIAVCVMAVVCFIMIPVMPRQLGSPQQYYDNYDLAPTVIAQVNSRDVVLMSLVETTVAGSGSPSRPGLALRTVTSIPGIQRKVGERVPSMAVVGLRTARDQDHWQEISPMPVAWGTQDRSVVAEAERAIPEADWKRLDDLLPRLEDVQATRRNLLELDK